MKMELNEIMKGAPTADRVIMSVIPTVLKKSLRDTLKKLHEAGMISDMPHIISICTAFYITLLEAIHAANISPDKDIKETKKAVDHYLGLLMNGSMVANDEKEAAELMCGCDECASKHEEEDAAPPTTASRTVH